jgi:hypothetical protein
VEWNDLERGTVFFTAKPEFMWPFTGDQASGLALVVSGFVRAATLRSKDFCSLNNLFEEAHRETERFFAASGVSLRKMSGQFHFRRVAFSSHL